MTVSELSNQELAEKNIAELRARVNAAIDSGKITRRELGVYSIPPRFIEKSLANFKGNEDQVKQAVDAIQSGQSLFITGSCGCGKTHLSCGLIAEWLKVNLLYRCTWDADRHFECGVAELKNDGYQPKAIFLPSAELFIELKAGMDRHTPESEIIREYSDCDLLILDDVGSEKVSDWSRQVFYTLIDRRYRYCKQTIITSNRTLGEISELIDDRIASRIVEMGIVIDLGDKDWRLAQ